jgi:hypothetical protein
MKYAFAEVVQSIRSVTAHRKDRIRYFGGAFSCLSLRNNVTSNFAKYCRRGLVGELMRCDLRSAESSSDREELHI